MKITSHPDPNSGEQIVTARFDPRALLGGSHLADELMRTVMDKIATELAAQFIAAHGQEVLAAIDPQAIATLIETVKREVYERGIFGGLKKL